MKSETLKTLEERYKVTLSQKYKQWYLNTDLSTCFVGSDIAPPYIYELTDWASKTLRKANIDFTLPKMPLCFLCTKGMSFVFLNVMAMTILQFGFLMNMIRECQKSAGRVSALIWLIGFLVMQTKSLQIINPRYR